jgi:NAD(P)-dependent dehydrogenase (short-subunit alcohol dehydrogenase family)
MHAIVTGATSGIGEAIARRLAGEGLTVTLAGRSTERLAAARGRIEAAVPGADLAVEQADLAELRQVRDLAARLLAGPRPDVVISNAALVTPLDRVTSDGLPRVLAVNHLAPYLLLRTLADGLDKARLVVVGADPASLTRAPVDLDDLLFADQERLGEPAELRPFFAYGRTKNMNAMFVYAFARRLAGTSVTINGVHPGIISGTGLSGEVPGLGELVRQAFRAGTLPQPGRQPGLNSPLDWTDQDREQPGPDTGADTPAWLATSPDVEGVSGRFFVDREVTPTAAHTTDVARCDQLWAESARLTGLPAEGPR